MTWFKEPGGKIFSAKVRAWDSQSLHTLAVYQSNIQSGNTFHGFDKTMNPMGDSTAHLGGDNFELVVQDFNGDGNYDIIARNKNGLADEFYRSNGDGTFTNLNDDGAFNPSNLKIWGDFNGDGLKDYILQDNNHWNDADTTHLHLSNGDGTFTEQSEQLDEHGWSLYGGAVNLIVGDFNGDGNDDFIRQSFGVWDRDSQNGNTLTAYLANFQSDNTFTFNKTRTPMGDSTANLGGDHFELVVQDFDGDGDDDIFARSKNGLGDEFYRSNGDGTFTQLNTTNGSSPRNAQHLTTAGDTLYFVADDGTGSNQLWKLNASGNAVVVNAPEMPGTSVSDPSHLTVAGDTLYFLVSNDFDSYQLWTIDASGNAVTVQNPWTEDETTPDMSAIQVFDPTLLAVAGDVLYFTAAYDADNDQLLKIDGSGDVVAVEQEKDPSFSDPTIPGMSVYNPIDLTVAGDTLYFVAANDSDNHRLWMIEPSGNAREVEIDVEMQDPEPTVILSADNPQHLNTVGDTLYFVTDGDQLLKIDPSGNVMAVEFTAGEAIPGAPSPDTKVRAHNPNNFTFLGDNLYFTAGDGTNGTELWRIKPGSDEPEMFSDINPSDGTSNPNNLIVLGDRLYFLADNGTDGRQLWQVDELGTPTRVHDHNGGITNATNLTLVGDRLYFTASEGIPGDGIELWMIDANNGETIKFDLNPSGGSNPSNFTVIGDTVYFVADKDGTNSTQLWRMNPDSGSPEPFTAINSGDGSANPNNLAVVDDTLYFVADDGTDGNQLWTIDGSGNAVKVGTGVDNPSNLTVKGDTLYFVADNGSDSHRLWKLKPDSDPVVVAPNVGEEDPGMPNPEPAPEMPGISVYSPNKLTVVDNTLYFVVDSVTQNAPALGPDPEPTPEPGTGYSQQLWKINEFGHPIEVTDAGMSMANPKNLTVVDDTLYFTSGDEFNGHQLWKIDPSGEPIMVWVDSGSVNNPSNLTVVGNTLYFTAEDQLWKIEDSGTPISVQEPDGSSFSNPANFTVVDDTLYFSTNDSTVWMVDANSGQFSNYTLDLSTFSNKLKIGGIADFDGDGNADILWHNDKDNSSSLSQIHGVDVTNPQNIQSVNDNLLVGGVGDFNGDGKADIFWRDQETGNNEVWLMDGSVVMEKGIIQGMENSGPIGSMEPGAIEGGNWQIEGISDFNGDNKADILWYDQSTGNNTLWLMDGLSHTAI